VAYKKPTLTETWAEVHLSTGSLTEARFFEVVPRLKELGFVDIEFATVGLSLEIGQGAPIPREKQRVRCWKPGRKELVQVGEDLLISNLTGDYPGWDAFVALFTRSLGALQDGLGTPDIRSLNLLTKDDFKVKKAGFLVSDYLNVGGPVVPRWYEGCNESLDLDMGYGLLETDGRNRQIHVTVHAAKDPIAVTIRANFHDRVEEGVDLLGMLERLHSESNATFESLITPRLRDEVMEGRVE